MKLRPDAACLVVALLVGNFSVALRAAEIFQIRVPAGEAAEALAALATQARLQIIFPADLTAGVRTRALHGPFSGREALDRLLAGTPLRAVQEGKDPIFALIRRDGERHPREPVNRHSPNPTESRKPTDTNMNTPTEKNKPRPRSENIVGLLALLLFGAPDDLRAQKIPPKEVAPGEAISLSKFVVVEAPEQGYRATTTLAGNRLKTELVDLGSAISVMTKEFMEDIGVTDVSSALPYGLNTESIGVQGNFSSTASQTSQFSTPHLEQRIRGVGSATLTRGFFRTYIPADTYNSENFTITRGPNSVMNGIGTAGGGIDNALSPARLDRTFGEVSLRFDHRGSARESFNYNNSVIAGRLAVRLAGLTESTKYKQEPTYEDDDRLYLAMAAVLRKPSNGVIAQTVVRANYERGKMQSLRSNVFPLAHEFPTWFGPPDLSLNRKYGRTFPSWMTETPYPAKPLVNNLVTTNPGDIKGNVGNDYLGQNFTLVVPNGTANAFRYNAVQGVQGNMGARFWNTGEYKPGNGFVVESVPRSVFDSENHYMGGDSGSVIQSFSATNVTLEQGLFGGKGGIELSYDRQQYKQQNKLAFSGTSIRIDVGQYLVTGQPNPNVGRPFIGPNDVTGRFNQTIENEALRLTAFYELDLRRGKGWLSQVLGRHVLSGFYTRDDEEEIRRNSRFAYSDMPNLDVGRILGQNLGGGNRAVKAMGYIGGSLLDPAIRTVGDVRTGQLDLSLLKNIKNGDAFRIAYRDPITSQMREGDFAVQKILTGGNTTRSEFTAKLATLQSYFFDGNLVALFGLRDDERKFYERLPSARLPAGVSRNFSDGTANPASIILSDVPLVTSARTLTKSLVGHLPAKWNLVRDHARVSAHWAQSENFSPVAVRRDMNARVLGEPSGKTTEKGLTLETPDRRFSVRFNWFNTVSAQSTIPTDAPRNGFPMVVQDTVTLWNNARVAGVPFATAYAFATSALNLPNAIAAGAKDPGFTSYDQVINAYINAYPAEPRSQFNPRFVGGSFVFDDVPGIEATQDKVAKGFEMDMTGNITKNWRLALNIAEQTTITSNSAPDARKFAELLESNLKTAGLYYLYRGPGVNLGDDPVMGNNFNSQVYRGILFSQLQDGTRSLEQRQWRFNVATNYAFSESSRLSGFSVGGALRHQSRVAIGYGLEFKNNFWSPILDKPVWGPAETNGDVWLKYQRNFQFGGRRIVWQAQLNVRNVIGGNERIPVYGNPDGTIGRYRHALPRDVFLTNTFKF